MLDKTELSTPPMNNAVLGAQSRIKQNATIRAGKEAIVTNRDTYLIKLDKQSTEQFKAMVEMAPMYILYPKVVDGFSGTVFAKAPVMKNIELNDKQKALNKNCDMLGNSIDKFSEKIVNTVFEDGFCASMNDYSDSAGRPFMRFIAPHQFISFRSSSVDGYPVITQFIYKEEIEVDDPDNEFSVDIKDRYTVMDIKDGSYRVRKYITKEKGSTAEATSMVQDGDDKYPKLDGNFIKVLPITIHGINQNNFSIEKSPLQDISDMNVSVFHRVIDQVYMLHWTALPTPWVTGVDGNDKDAPTTIGPSELLTIANPDAKIGMLEFSGNAARAHQDFIDNLKDIMASMGAQILKKEGVSRETATSVLVRTAAQTSLIATLVNNVSGQIGNVLKLFFEWGGTKVQNDFLYELNDDFLKVDMEPNAQIALVKSWLDGAISRKTMFNKMKEGEIIDTNVTYDEELEEIKKDPPMFFAKKADLDNAIELSEKTGGNDNMNSDNGGNVKKATNGSNLDNGNLNNRQTD